MIKNTFSIRLLFVFVAACLVCGCDGSDSSSAQNEGPKIAVLAPHIAEIAYSLGLRDNIVAVGRYCRQIEGLDVPAVSDAVSVNCEALAATGAKLIFHNSRQEFFTPLVTLDEQVNVVQLPNASLAELYDGILTMGSLTAKQSEAESLVNDLKERLAAVAARSRDLPRPRVLFLIGFDPPGTVGSGWLTAQLLEIAGGRNAAADAGFSGWVTLNMEAIADLKPDVIICQIQPGQQTLDRAEIFADKLRSICTGHDLRIHFSADNSLTIPGTNVAQTAELFYDMIHSQDAGSDVSSLQKSDSVPTGVDVSTVED